MKNTYTYPTQIVQFFDVTPLTVHLHVLVAMSMALMDVRWLDVTGFAYVRAQTHTKTHTKADNRRYERALKISYRVRCLVKAIVKVRAHNAMLRSKLDMLANPAWRGRVLKDLGGMRRLKLWDAQWRKHLEHMAGDAPKPWTVPEKPEPVWWRSPERVAESERLKAHARFCRQAAANPRSFKDPFKVDFEGEFRLGPIPRTAYHPAKPRIYSKVDICEYRYDAMPVSKDFGMGVSRVYPMEFYAAMDLEKNAYDDIPHSGHFAKQVARDAGPNRESQSLEAGPESAANGLVRDDKVERDDNIETIYVSANDNHAMIEFIGRKNYKYILDDPG